MLYLLILLVRIVKRKKEKLATSFFKIDANKTKASASDGIETILNGVELHVDDIYICIYGCIALQSIIDNGIN